MSRGSILTGKPQSNFFGTFATALPPTTGSYGDIKLACVNKVPPLLQSLSSSNTICPSSASACGRTRHEGDFDSGWRIKY